jgi:hypothetical protein
MAYLKVFPNPFVHVDAQGRANGHMQYEPNPRGEPNLRWIGCRCVATRTPELETGERPTGLAEALRKEKHDHHWEYFTEPTQVRPSIYYQRAIQHHDLFPADVATHTYAFGSPDGFIDARVRLAQLAKERGVIPDLEWSGDVAKPEKRDRTAEWAAFVGPAMPAPAKTSRASASTKTEGSQT